MTRLPCHISGAGGESNAAPWTTEEQKLLEQALKTYPVSTPERWEKIAAAVPGRNKKDCMKRYKVRKYGGSIVGPGNHSVFGVLCWCRVNFINHFAVVDCVTSLIYDTMLIIFCPLHFYNKIQKHLQYKLVSDMYSRFSHRNWWRWLKPRKQHRSKWPRVKNDKNHKKTNKQ